MKIFEIGHYLESLAPLSFQEDYDNCGFLAGNPEWEFEKALLCLDLTEDVMKEAIEKHCNLIISHHPFIFKSIKKFTSDQPETTIIALALMNNIAVYAIHTNLDNSLHGLNATVFSKLGISKYKILSPRQGLLSKLITFCPVEHAEKIRNAMFEAGAGNIGTYSCCSYNVKGEGTFRASDQSNPFVGEKNKVHFEKEIRIEVVFPGYLENRILNALMAAHPYEEVAFDIYPIKNVLVQSGSGLIGELEQPMDQPQFMEFVKKSLEIPVIRHSDFLLTKIKTVALCTGSGGFLIPAAVISGANVFLTADLKYHDFFGMKKKMLLADIGHYESEQWVKEWLYDALIEKFPTFAFLISEVNTNPVHYF